MSIGFELYLHIQAQILAILRRPPTPAASRPSRWPTRLAELIPAPRDPRSRDRADARVSVAMGLFVPARSAGQLLAL
jgi:hypothetical protein